MASALLSSRRPMLDTSSAMSRERDAGADGSRGDLTTADPLSRANATHKQAGDARFRCYHRHRLGGAEADGPTVQVRCDARRADQ